LNALCVKAGVRPTHIRAIIPLALELVFTPSLVDIEAAQLRASRSVLDRIYERDKDWYTHDPRWLMNWFGARRTRPAPSA